MNVSILCISDIFGVNLCCSVSLFAIIANECINTVYFRHLWCQPVLWANGFGGSGSGSSFMGSEDGAPPNMKAEAAIRCHLLLSDAVLSCHFILSFFFFYSLSRSLRLLSSHFFPLSPHPLFFFFFSLQSPPLQVWRCLL